MVDFSAPCVERVPRRPARESTPTQDILPIGKGVDRDAWGETVLSEAAAQADAARTAVLGGASQFVGEIKDSKGAVRVAAGQTMIETELYNWDWSINGVMGL